MPDRPDDAPRQPTMIDPSAALGARLVPPDPADDPGSGPVGGRYELRELLGAGGMCDVWRAHDPVLDREVAVKRLLPHYRDDHRVRERFSAEALRVAKLTHPGIVGVLDAGEDGGSPFLVMELVDGPTLADHLRQTGPLRGEEVVAIGLAVARGLGAAHRAGVVHRDVKPGNILMDRRHGARLTDFGIAKATADVDMTATGEVIGTAAYLAPEQAMGQVVDARSDVYGLGCVLYECLTGARPFTGDTPVQVASARIGVQLRVSDRMAGVIPHLDDVVATAMAPDPDDRWSDGDAIARALASGVREGWRPDGAPTVPAAATATQRLPAATAAMTTPLEAAEAFGTGGGGSPERTQSLPSAGGPGAFAPPPVPRTPRQPSGGPRRSRTAPLAVVAAVAVLLAAAFGLTRLGGGADVPVTTASEVATSAPAEPVADAPLTGVTGTAFDPAGGDGENDADVPLLFDGDPATQWTTVGYNSAAFGNLKTGVGVVVDLGAEVALAEVRLLGLAPGQSIEVRSAAQAPTTIADTTVVASGTALGAEVALQPDAATTTRFLVIWLVPDLPADGGRFRGAIGEVQVFGS